MNEQRPEGQSVGSSALLDLTEREREVLNELAHLRDRPTWTRRRNGWATPLDFGGSNGSHHSYTATKLAKKGLVLREKLAGGPRDRGSCMYRITDSGLAALTYNEPAQAAGRDSGQSSLQRLVGQHGGKE